VLLLSSFKNFSLSLILTFLENKLKFKAAEGKTIVNGTWWYRSLGSLN